MNLDQIWEAAVRALHASKGITRSDLDAFVHDETKGQITTFAGLAQARMQHERIASQQEQADIRTPSALRTFAQGAMNGVGFGLPGAMTGNSGDPDIINMKEDMAAGAEAHPMADFLGNMFGGAAPSAISAGAAMPATSAAVDAVPFLSKLPGLFRTGIAGGLATAPAAGIQAATAGGGPKEIAEQMGLAAAIGTPLSMGAGWAAARYSPAEHLAGRAVQEAAPGVPGLAAGRGALQEGTTTPVRVGNPDRGIIHQPLSDAAAARLPEELRPLNFEKSASLRTLAAREITKSAEATAQAEAALRERLTRVITVKRGLENDLQVGYDALLNDHPIQSPEALDLYRQQTGTVEPPTARQLFNLAKKLGRKADQAFEINKKGTGAPDLDLAEQQGEMAQNLRDVLGQEVPGFNDLQAKVAPYLQRQRELQASMRSIIGRAVKPIGKTAGKPKGGLQEGVRESLGYEPTQIEEKASRDLVTPLFRSTDTQGLLNFIKEGGILKSKLRFAPGAQTGAFGGAASSNTPMGRKLRGLFPWLMGQAQ